MRVTFLLVLALCVYLSAAYKERDDSGESGEKWDKGKKNYKKDKYYKQEKYDKYNKQGKYDKYEKYNKHEKRERDRDSSDESNESQEFERENFVQRPRYDERKYDARDERSGNKKYYEKEYNHYKYNKFYDEEEGKQYKKQNKKDKHHKEYKQDQYQREPEHGFFDEAIQFSKRRLFSAPEDEDNFFDDVKQYNSQQQRENHYQQQQPRHESQSHEYHNQQQQRYPAQQQQYRQHQKHNSHYKHQQREWQEPQRIQYEEQQQAYAERYPGGDGDFKEFGGPSTRYTWKQDREDFHKMRPLSIPAPEKPYRDFAAATDVSDPPPHTEIAKMARFIVHNADWTMMATISTQPHIRHYPFVNVLSMSDGPVEKGTGIPYFYMTDLDLTSHDLASNRKCSLSMTLAETEYCKQQNLDPEDPRCAHVTLTGKVWKLRNGTQSYKLAEEAMFSRHPSMKTWPADHKFFFTTLKIEQIVLLDYFGGAKYIDVKDYLRATPSA